MLIIHNTQLPHIHTLLQSSFPNTLNTQNICRVHTEIYMKEFIFKKHEQSYLAPAHLISHTYSG